MVFVGLIRGINVGGHRRVPMAALRESLTLDGVDALNTYLQSGNLVLQSRIHDTASLSGKLEKAMFRYFNMELPLILLPLGPFRRILKKNPFFTEAAQVQKQLYYIFFKRPPHPELESRLLQRSFPNESWSMGADCMYIRCRKGYGKAKLTNTLVEKLGETPATARNHRTVSALLQMGEEIS